jgi:hypothetical protein
MVIEEMLHLSPKCLSFKQWLFREYRNLPDMRWHPSWELTMEIEARWPDFPETTAKDPDAYLHLANWISDNGGCAKCLRAFKKAWDNYVNDS